MQKYFDAIKWFVIIFLVIPFISFVIQKSGQNYSPYTFAAMIYVFFWWIMPIFIYAEAHMKKDSRPFEPIDYTTAYIWLVLCRPLLIIIIPYQKYRKKTECKT